MVIDTVSLAQVLLSILLFPTTFQTELLQFVWGEGDDLWILLSKRLFLLLPGLAVIAGAWTTIPCFVTVIFRHRRKEFLTLLLLAWWDLGRAVVAFWGGIFKFVVILAGDLFSFLKIVVVGVFMLLRDILFLPFRLVRSAGQSVVRSTVPWIAVFLTILWCVVEAIIFTYVTTPLVVDTLSNVTGEQLSMGIVRVPLFIFLLFIVLGSYAVLSNFVDAVKSKNIPSIASIAVIELVVLFVEVLFLYREFVDSLVPWFAQYSESFELGAFWTIAIAALAWFGIRSVSWFLFAGHGTPTILAVIQGKGVRSDAPAPAELTNAVPKLPMFTDTLKAEAEWARTKGDELLAAFMLPPLHIIAAGINFCTLLVNGRPLFEVPFSGVETIATTKQILEGMGTRPQPSEREPAGEGGVER